MPFIKPPLTNVEALRDGASFCLFVRSSVACEIC